MAESEYITLLLMAVIVMETAFFRMAVCDGDNGMPADLAATLMTIANSSSSAKPVADLDDEMPQFATSLDFAARQQRSKLVTVFMSINYLGAVGTGPIAPKSLELALDRFYASDNWLSGYEVALELFDDRCEEAPTVNGLMENIQRKDVSRLNRLSLMFISTCSAQWTSAEVIKYYNTIGMAMQINSPEFLVRRKRYPTFFGIAECWDKYYMLSVKFAVEMGWKQMSVISSIDWFYNYVDHYLVAALFDHNVTLGWLGKIRCEQPDSNEVSESLEEWIGHDQRILLVSADCAPEISCWLHRKGTFGPSYAFIFVNWIYSPPADTPVPDFLASWCTQEMIAQVYEGAFFMGDSALMDIVSDEYVGTAGLNASEFISAMKAKINHAEDFVGWQYWRTVFYDAGVYLAMVLNKTEEILNKRNESLLDWTVTSQNFQERPSEILKTYEEAIYSTRVTGFRGIYALERETTYNSGGYVPQTLSQVQNAEDLSKTPDQFIVAIFQSNNKTKPTTIRHDLIKWRTKDGLPPRDRPLLIDVEVSMMPYELVGFLIAVALILAIFQLVLLILAKRHQVKITRQQILIFIGNSVTIVHVFLLPSSDNMTKQVGPLCMTVSLLVATGYTLSMLGMLAHLSHVKNTIRDLPSVPTAKHGQRKSQTNQSSFASTARSSQSVAVVIQAVNLVKKEGDNTEPQKFFFVTQILPFFLINEVLIATFFALEPLGTIKVNRNLLYSKEDASLAYHTYTFLPDTPINTAGLTVAAIFALFHLVLITRTVILAYKLKKRMAKLPSPDNVATRILLGLYCVILLFIAACFLVLVLGFSFIVPIVSFTINLYVLITTCLIFVTKKLFGLRSLPATAANIATQPASKTLGQMGLPPQEQPVITGMTK